MKILMVEDEKYIAEAIAQVLKQNYYAVDLAYDGEYGLDCALSNMYDIIILDIMLPKKDGLTVLKEMRQNGIKTPTILLTAKGHIEDKVHGLDCGADDYIPKPFHTDELLARLRALGRRPLELNNEGILTFGDIQLNPHTLLLTCRTCDATLTIKEAQLMELLIRRKNTPVSKEHIIEKLWGYDSDAEDNRVEIHVSLLRKKIGQVQSGVSLRTIRGVGYLLQDGKGGT
ncbi:DNA-binding response regulator [Paenibacillus sp. 598K]|uniref:response regulator transcription factor n=1 Tax=Paenibacillus sp. 598K TaxID=1117987 RepID=UPI000FFA529B|nr:response regulator transcription factor [Paenibacillus sp. 598K]GBF75246.1 DNA-binding response regulator [Paenibacillus sp. 598K]